MYLGSAPPWVRHYTQMIMDAPRKRARGIRAGAYASGVSWLMGSRLGQYLAQ